MNHCVTPKSPQVTAFFSSLRLFSQGASSGNSWTNQFDKPNVMDIHS